MLKKHATTLLITSIVTILPILIGIICWNRLPDEMAIHFGLNNEPDGFASKPFTVCGIPLILLTLLWVGAFATSRDPKNNNISPKIFMLVLWIVPVISLIAMAIIYSYNMRFDMNVSFFGMIIVGLLFTILGNYMPKTRQNYTIGIKIPWTLANEENWNLTHRFAGYLWMICGLLIIMLCLTQLVSFEWIIAIVVMAALVPCIYSFWLHAKKGL